MSAFTRVLTVVIISWFTFFLSTANADELNFNLIHLVAEAEKEVENDTMRVILSASEQAPRAADAAKTVNEIMEWALNKTKKVNEIKSRTTSYHTNPIYKNQKVVEWRASQQIELETKNFNVMTSLIGELQEKMQITSMQFEVSNEVRRGVEDDLTEEALNRFSTRAELIQKTIGADKYQIVSVQIHTQGHQPPVYGRMRATSSVMAAAMPEPSVEGGMSTIKVNVSGEIQLGYL